MSKGTVVGILVLWVCTLGGYFFEKEGWIKNPAYFVTWGYACGLLAAVAMRWFS